MTVESSSISRPSTPSAESRPVVKSNPSSPARTVPCHKVEGGAQAPVSDFRAIGKLARIITSDESAKELDGFTSPRLSNVSFTPMGGGAGCSSASFDSEGLDTVSSFVKACYERIHQQKSKSQSSSATPCSGVDDILIKTRARTPLEKAWSFSVSKLEEDLDKLYHFIQKNDQCEIFRGIPQENLYKLFIDAGRWSESDDFSYSPLFFDVKEPGYLSALIKAFMVLFSESPELPSDSDTASASVKKLSPEFISLIHDIAITDVQTARRDGETGRFFPGYRDKKSEKDSRSGEQFGLVHGSTLSESGYQELIAKFKDTKYLVDVEDSSDRDNLFGIHLMSPKSTILLSRPSSIEVKIPTPDKTPYIFSFREDEIEFSSSESFHTSVSPHSPACIKIKETFAKEGSPVCEKEIMKKVSAAYNRFTDDKALYESPCIKLYPSRNLSILENSIRQLIKVYEDEVSCEGIDVEGKIKSILRFVQNLDQIHPFYDGNIRTFSVLLIQKLLIDQGITPVCFDDPNCVDCLSIDEILGHFRKGQSNFLSLKSDSVSKVLEFKD